MNDGEVTRERALQIARMVMRDNAIKLYSLKIVLKNEVEWFSASLNLFAGQPSRFYNALQLTARD